MYIIKRPRRFIIREVGDGPQCFAGSRRDGDSLLRFDGERRAHGIAMTVPMEYYFSTCNFFPLLLPSPTSPHLCRRPSDTSQFAFRAFNYWLSTRGRIKSGNGRISKSACALLSVSFRSCRPQLILSGVLIIGTTLCTLCVTVCVCVCLCNYDCFPGHLLCT